MSLEGRAAQNIAATDRRHTLLPGEPVSALRLSLLQADIVALCILIRSTEGGGLCSAGALPLPAVAVGSYVRTYLPASSTCC